MINIRPHVREDVKYRVKWLNNINATCFAVEKPEQGTTLEAQEQWFDRYEVDPNKEFFILEYSGQPIGFMGLSNIDREKRTANLFILIGEDDFRGKGLGKEAMDWLIQYAWHDLNLTSLALEVSKENQSTVNLYKKLGFGVVREDGAEFEMSLKR